MESEEKVFAFSSKLIKARIENFNYNQLRVCSLAWQPNRWLFSAFSLGSETCISLATQNSPFPRLHQLFPLFCLSIRRCAVSIHSVNE